MQTSLIDFLTINMHVAVLLSLHCMLLHVHAVKQDWNIQLLGPTLGYSDLKPVLVCNEWALRQC